VAGTRTTRLLAALRRAGGGFAAAEEVATGTVVLAGQPSEAGTDISLPRAAISDTGTADVTARLVDLIGLPGDFGMEGAVYSRPAGSGWGSAQPLGSVDARLSSTFLEDDLVAGRAGDALYMANETRAPLSFSGHIRSEGAAAFGPRFSVFSGGPGETRAAAVTAGRFLAVARSDTTVRSAAGSAAAGFAPPLTVAATGARELLGAAANASGEGVAAWQTTAGSVQAALYDDNAVGTGGGRAGAGAAADTTPPVLSGLAVAPRRFAVRRESGRSARGGTTIRWRLSERAAVEIRVERLRSGYRSGVRGGAARAVRPGAVYAGARSPRASRLCRGLHPPV
jgi:hypothetical protein